MHLRIRQAPFKKFDPAVDKKFLIALSGLAWLIAGIILCRLSIIWLSLANLQTGAVLSITGAVTALLIHWFGFSRLVNRNIERILSKDGKICVFAFQPWKSYLIIVIMVGIGIALRHSPLPKPYLSVVYIGFGGAMVLSSVRYLRVFLKLIIK